MDTSRDRSSALIGLMIVSISLGCARTKAAAPAPAMDGGDANIIDAGGPVTLLVDASDDGFEINGKVDLSGAVPQANMAGAGEATSKSTIQQVCFAPNSAKLPADIAATLEPIVKEFKGKKVERKRLTVEPVITPKDSQATASKVRAQRTAAIVGALLKKGLDRKSIFVTGPEVPQTEWSMSSMFGGPPMFGGGGEERAPCVEVGLVTKETTPGGGSAL